MSSSDDEDIKRAIALSMQDSHEVINLDSDDESASSKQPLSQQQPGLLGLDRKKMEQERLSRKRKISVSPPPARKSCKISSPQPDFLTQDRMVDPAAVSSRNGNHPLEPLYLQGKVMKTWAFGHSRSTDDIKLEEVLQKNDLNLAVLSSFQWDVAWLLAKISLQKTQLTLIMQAKDEATKQQHKRETADMRNLRLCFPSMEGQVNCMHSKLMLLSYPGHLRVVVPTANLVPYDWGESGDMENMVFIIDLPRLPNGQRVATETAFRRELVYFLNAKGLEQSIVDSVSQFDFGATKSLAFVHTIGGAHSGESWRRTGYCGLGRAVKELGLATKSTLNIDFITSSVGSLNFEFLASLYLAAQGDDGTAEYGWRSPQTGSKAKLSKSALVDDEAAREKIRNSIREKFHIYFPTRETVKASTAGYAGTICFQSKWYNSAVFPRQTMRDCKSTRTGLLMHNKVLYVRPEDFGSGAWAYVGSANCSESAWGKLFKDRTTKAPKLNCRNWECGVIVPVGHAEGKTSQEGLTAFDGTVPVPMQFPGDAYGNKSPWYYAEQ